MRDLRRAEPPHQLQLDMLGRQVVEQEPALAEEHRHDVQLELVEFAGAQQRLPGAGAMHQHVGVPGCGASPRSALAHVGDEADGAGRRAVRDVVRQHEDRHSVVVVALPVVRVFVGAAAGDERAGSQGGFGDELRVVLAGATGTWGQLTVFREGRRPHFTDSEVRFVSSLAGLIADGLRRGLLLDDAHSGADVGILVLDAEDTVSMINAATEHWLDALGRGGRAGAQLPLVVPAVARQARAVCAGGTEAGAEVVRPARARVQTGSGQWLIVRGSLLSDGPRASVAVLLEPARQAEVASLLAAAYGLSERERRITELVAQGLSTRRMADRLRVSEYTVQDHLKSIFTKTGTSSRGDLIARLFYDHFAGSLTSVPAHA